MTKRELIEQLREARKQARNLERAVERILEEAESPQNDTDDWIDQHQSALGSKRHCAAVRRRLGEGKKDAEKIGRRHRLSPSAYAEERALVGQLRLARCEQSGSVDEDAAYQALVRRLEQ